MTGALFPSTNGNGSSSGSGCSWLQQSVQQFFSRFNWENHPPEVQKLQLLSELDGDCTASLTLTVNQFFSIIHWEGEAFTAQGEMPHTDTAQSLENSLFSAPATDSLTLDDFSDLF